MTIYDEQNIRYRLYPRPSGFQKSGINWLFVPCPGADSIYLKSLADCLEIPGNIWLIDLPGNGSHITENSYPYEAWLNIFPGMVTHFENPILVAHSFGGCLPLLFSELEQHLKGIVLLNAAPSLWLNEVVSYAKQFQLTDLSPEMAELTNTPKQEAFQAALNACMPYCFPFFSIEKGKALVTNTPFNYEPAVWWLRKAVEIEFSAKWIPQNIPTMIVGSSFDCIAPFTLFQKDQRFARENIELHLLEDCGHLPWIEKPEKVNHLFKSFTYRALNAACFAIAT